ncbi:MAG TPA: iron-containing alcohol dehydrogenase [Gammaproteobacteria bacterium]|nr:iron-containing alcohol dehydrogenase [Gammaproteobacteria bacterium]
MLPAFSIARLPRIEFGAGAIDRLPGLAASHGRHALLVLGAASFQRTPQWERLQTGLQEAGMKWQLARVDGEPSPEQVDALVAEFRPANHDLVIGIGGGSVLDAAKAIAGLLRVPHSVMDFLEGVGPELPYPGPALPFIAVPTTAGTGSEATKNAVLSRAGADGFKKSFRDEQLVPQLALVDPDLLAGCPSDLIAANGMDALTQLLESYVSLRANPFTDALAWSGLEAVRDSLLDWHADPQGNGAARCGMAYGALLSGITLAQVGLGSVHGLAAPLGAFFPIPHGVVCGTLVAAATRMNLDALHARAPGHPALTKYARLGELFCQRSFSMETVAQEALVERLEDWTRRLRLPRLGEYGIGAGDLDHIAAHSRGSSMKTNPIELTDEELKAVLSARL